jgi:uncharacterized membrane protein
MKTLFKPQLSAQAMNSETAQYAWMNLLFPIVLIAGLVWLLSLNVGAVIETKAMITPLEPWLQSLVAYMAGGAEMSAAVVIGFAVFRSIGQYLYELVTRTDPYCNSLASIRLRLGRVLALGLEFTIASDILRTVVSPTRQEIMNLGAIVLLRSLLNYFLEAEINAGESRRMTEAVES